MVELAALLAALFDGAEPLLDPGGLSTLPAQPEQRFWLLRDLQQLLERAALESPLLIAIDDAHWADSGTVAALRTLPMRLMGLPIAWVIALRPPREASPLAQTLEQLNTRGRARSSSAHWRTMPSRSWRRTCSASSRIGRCSSSWRRRTAARSSWSRYQADHQPPEPHLV